jgi:asparaginyl-tRNA synthetase
LLTDFLRNQIVDVVSRVLSDPFGAQAMKELNPDFKPPQKPFRRMAYVDAIKWLNDHGIKNAEGKDFEFGEDIPEAPGMSI